MRRSAFSRLAPGDGSVARHAPGGIGGDRSVVDDTEQVHLVVGGLAIHRTDPDREALDVVNQVLGGGLSSRLFDEIRERRGLVYSVFSSGALYSDIGAYTISAGSQPRHADEVISLVLAELEKLRTGGITDDELDTIVSTLRVTSPGTERGTTPLAGGERLFHHSSLRPPFLLFFPYVTCSHHSDLL